MSDPLENARAEGVCSGGHAACADVPWWTTTAQDAVAVNFRVARDEVPWFFFYFPVKMSRKPKLSSRVALRVLVGIDTDPESILAFRKYRDYQKFRDLDKHFIINVKCLFIEQYILYIVFTNKM